MKKGPPTVKVLAGDSGLQGTTFEHFYPRFIEYQELSYQTKPYLAFLDKWS